MKSTDAALTGGVPGCMMVEGVFSLSKNGGRIGMVGDGAENCNGGLEIAILLK